MHKKEIFLALPLFLSAMIFFMASPAITGAFIGSLEGATSNLLGVILFSCSVILLIHANFDKKGRLEEVVEEFQKGNINPIEAARQIDNIVSIQAVKFKPGFEHSVQTREGTYPIHLKEGELAVELAFAEYFLANKNNPAGHSQFHIGKNGSTKHHKKGFEKESDHFRQRFLLKYPENAKSL